MSIIACWMSALHPASHRFLSALDLCLNHPWWTDFVRNLCGMLYVQPLDPEGTWVQLRVHLMTTAKILANSWYVRHMMYGHLQCLSCFYCSNCTVQFAGWIAWDKKFSWFPNETKVGWINVNNIYDNCIGFFGFLFFGISHIFPPNTTHLYCSFVTSKFMTIKIALNTTRNL